MLFRRHFFNESDSRQITDAIAQAEMQTSGEIRVHVEPRCKGDVLVRAAAVFHKLKMQETTKRNAVLIYLAHDDRRFAIIGDRGINDVVPPDFWDTTKETMAASFKNSRFTEGVIHGINECAVHLKKYFPHEAGAKNQLSNEISEG